MDFSKLHYFRTIAKLGNLSQAAEVLYISQPGLSRYLTRLEQEVGVPLFQRRKGRIELNTYGQVFLAAVEQAFDSLDRGVNSAQQLYARDQNILSISCSIEDYLTDLIAEFSPQCPEIGVRQLPFSGDDLERQLLAGTLDLAICAHPPKHSRLTFDLLSQCPYVLVCHENHPLGTRAEINLQEASRERFLCENPRLGRAQLEEICLSCGFMPTISHQVESGNTLLRLLEANAGVALMPLAYYLNINARQRGHHLHAISLRNNIPMAQIGVVHLGDRPGAPAAERFVAFLHESAQKEATEFTA